MRSIIMNADDFGMSKEVNEGIKKGIKLGIITSVSVMVNMPYFADAISFLKKNPQVSVGLHFNMTEGKPILEPKHVGTLLREDNDFFYWTQHIIMSISKKMNHSHVEKELTAQYNKLKETGLPITHIDSHHHIHLFPSIFTLFYAFTKSKKNNSLRFQQFSLWNLTLGMFKKPTKTQIIINFLLLYNNIFHRNSEHVHEIDRFYDISWDTKLTEEEFLKILNNLPTGRTELICHLGIISPLGNRTFLKPRYHVLKLISLPSIKQYLLKKEISLIKRDFLQYRTTLSTLHVSPTDA